MLGIRVVTFGVDTVAKVLSLALLNQKINFSGKKPKIDL